jgi:hypothetical protein
MNNNNEEIKAGLARDFDGSPLALAAAVSEIRTMTESPAMRDANSGSFVLRSADTT